MQNIDRLFFRRNGELQTEFEELYHALFMHAENYTLVVRLLSNTRQGMTREELAKATGMAPTMLTTVLRNLERCDFVLRYSMYGNYYRFINDSNSQDEQWWSHNFQSHAVEAWQGYSFELICLMHLNQIKLKLGISGISTSASTWRYVPPKKDTGEKGAQIDLLIERADRIINLCEMKFSVKPYRLSEDYEQALRNRMEIFQAKTKTTKSLFHTFVTTFGIVNGQHRSIVGSEATMNDLFAASPSH